MLSDNFEIDGNISILEENDVDNLLKDNLIYDLLNSNDLDLLENIENLLVDNIMIDGDMLNIDLNINIDLPEYLTDHPKGRLQSSIDQLSKQII